MLNDYFEQSYKITWISNKIFEDLLFCEGLSHKEIQNVINRMQERLDSLDEDNTGKANVNHVGHSCIGRTLDTSMPQKNRENYCGQYNGIQFIGESK